MKDVTFRFFRPNSLIGRLISWRLREPWSHVCIIIDDIAYSAQMPWVVMLPLSDRDVAMPPRAGFDLKLSMSEGDIQHMKLWCESQVGKPYDYLSVVGWALGVKWIQNNKNSYCYEYCRSALEHIGWLQDNNDLIKGNRLIDDIETLIRERLIDPSKIENIHCQMHGDFVTNGFR